MNAASTLAVLLTTAAICAQVQVPPPGLNPGDPYRILFVTDSMRDATSTDIAD